MKCKRMRCENDVVSTGNRVKEFCSDRCRMIYSRQSKANTQTEQIESEQSKANIQPPEVVERVRRAHQSAIDRAIFNKGESAPPTEPRTNEDVEPAMDLTTETPLEAEVHDIPSLEHYRCCPDQYAKRENPDKLNWGDHMGHDELAMAGFKANRVPIPGDFDYEGVAV